MKVVFTFMILLAVFCFHFSLQQDMNKLIKEKFKLEKMIQKYQERISKLSKLETEMKKQKEKKVKELKVTMNEIDDQQERLSTFGSFNEEMVNIRITHI